MPTSPRRSRRFRRLFAIGARLADPRSRIAERVTKAAIQNTDIERLERLIDALEGEVPPLRRFILPGGSSCGALLHQARTVCRRVERRVVALRLEAIPWSSSTSIACRTCCS